MAVILGAIGMNFGAGMTGGLTWIYDEDGSVLAGRRFHEDFLTPQTFAEAEEAAQDKLHGLLQEHAERSGSSLAEALLADWAKASAHFLQLVPKPQV